MKASANLDPRFEWRVHIALWAARAALKVPGDFVECGVNAGFISSAIMEGLNWNSAGRRFFLIDTFSGPVREQYTQKEVKGGRLRIAEEALAAGAYVTDLERVRNNYAEWRDVQIVRGAIPEVLPAAGVGKVAFLHIDMNCAYPETEALRFSGRTWCRGVLCFWTITRIWGMKSRRERWMRQRRGWVPAFYRCQPVRDC